MCEAVEKGYIIFCSIEADQYLLYVDTMFHFLLRLSSPVWGMLAGALVAYRTWSSSTCSGWSEVY